LQTAVAGRWCQLSAAKHHRRSRGWPQRAAPFTSANGDPELAAQFLARHSGFDIVVRADWLRPRIADQRSRHPGVNRFARAADARNQERSIALLAWALF